jgi:hypothetical protein
MFVFLAHYKNLFKSIAQLDNGLEIVQDILY